MRATKPKTSFAKPQLSIDSTNHKPITTMSGQTQIQTHQSGVNNSHGHEGISVMSNIDRSQNG